MKKSKKGFTLIELMIGLLVLAAAILSGTQLFSAAAHGYSNSVRLQAAADKLASVFDTAPAPDKMPAEVTCTKSGATVKIILPNGKAFTEGGGLVSLLYNDGKVKAKLFGLDNSYGK